MTAVRATRTPQGAPYTTGTGPESIRHRANAPWPGLITRTALCSCTRAMKDGVYQVKVRDAACAEHLRAVSGG